MKSVIIDRGDGRTVRLQIERRGRSGDCRGCLEHIDAKRRTGWRCWSGSWKKEQASTA